MPFSSFTSLFKTARTEQQRRVASEDYPELGTILEDRPNPALAGKQAAAELPMCSMCNQEPATTEVSGSQIGERCAEHLFGIPGAGTEPPGFGQAVYGSHTAAHQDAIRARRAGRPMVCNDCANAMGGFDAGWRNVDDSKAETCARCGKPNSAKIIDANFDQYLTYGDDNLPVRTEEDTDYTPPWSHTAGIMDWLDRKLSPYAPEVGARWSFDWCRFRRDSHCYFPSHLDNHATQLAGYAVWVPQDRGTCPRTTWDQQKRCPIGQPGPNSGDPHSLTDATKSWAQGGQRGGTIEVHGAYFGEDADDLRRHLIIDHGLLEASNPDLSYGDCEHYHKWSLHDGEDHEIEHVKNRYPGLMEKLPVAADSAVMDRPGPLRWQNSEPYQHRYENIEQAFHHMNSLHVGALDRDDADFRFHFTAAWRDITAKAKRIRTEGGVRIINAPTPKNPYVVAEVKGDHHTYQSTILRQIGSKAVAGWECTCAWAHYAWGRSGRWKKFEGRMCSHVLATLYQAQSEEMFGGNVKEVEQRPVHFDDVFHYKAPEIAPWRVGSRHSTEHIQVERAAPIMVEARCQLEEGRSSNEVLAWLRDFGVPSPESILVEALSQPFVARDPQREQHTIVEINGEHAITDAGEAIHLNDLTHPDFDWESGLDVGPHDDPRHSPEDGTEWAEDRLSRNGFVSRTGAEGAVCRHCQRPIKQEGGAWVDPEATGDDSVWRETCDSNHSSFTAEHEPRRRDVTHIHTEPLQLDRLVSTNSLKTAAGMDPVEVGTDENELEDHADDLGTEDGMTTLSMLRWAKGPWDPGKVIAPHNKPQGIENWDATHWERLPEEEQNRQAATPLREHSLDHEGMVKNVLKAHEYAKQDPSQYEEDARWYEDQHSAIKTIAKTSSSGRPKGMGTAKWTRAVFGATASLSPNTAWHHNLNLAHYMAHNYHKYNHIEDPVEASSALWADAKKEGLRSYNPDKGRDEGLQGPGYVNMGKAMHMLRGHGDPHHVIGGHKVRSFFNNLIDPHGEQQHGDSVTTDRHHFGVLAGAFLGSDAAARIFGQNERTGTNTKGSYALTASATREAHRRLQEAGEIPKDWTPSHLQAGLWGPHRRDAEEAFNAMKGHRRRLTKDPSVAPPKFRLPLIEATIGDFPNDPTTIDPEYDPYEDEPDPDLDPKGNEAFWAVHDLREKVEQARKKDRKRKATMLRWAGLSTEALGILEDHPEPRHLERDLDYLFDKPRSDEEEAQRDYMPQPHTNEDLVRHLSEHHDSHFELPDYSQMDDELAGFNRDEHRGILEDEHDTLHRYMEPGPHAHTHILTTPYQDLKPSGEFDRPKRQRYFPDSRHAMVRWAADQQLHLFREWGPENEEERQTGLDAIRKIKEDLAQRKPRTSMLHWGSLHNTELHSLDGSYDDRDAAKYFVKCHTCKYQSHPMAYDMGIEHKRDHERHADDPRSPRSPDFLHGPYLAPGLNPDDNAQIWGPNPGEMRDYYTSQPEADLEFRHMPSKLNSRMTRWAGVDAADTPSDDGEDMGDDATSAQMDRASEVQKDYRQRADQAQDDFYFNYPQEQKLIEDNHASLPTYMSFQPTGMKRWATPGMDDDFIRRIFHEINNRQRDMKPKTRPAEYTDCGAPKVRPDARHEGGDDGCGWGTLCPRHPQTENFEERVHNVEGPPAVMPETKPYVPHPNRDPSYLKNSPVTSSMHRWADVATLHEEPQPALPSTDGEGPSEQWERQHSGDSQDPISAGPAGFGAPADPGYAHEDLGAPEADAAVLSPSSGPGAGSLVNETEKQFQSLDYTSSLEGDAAGESSRAWLLAGGRRNAGGDRGISSLDIAAMARRVLETGEIPADPKNPHQAAKVFTPKEQQELIHEGSDGTRASNLDRLQLEGTHYLALEDDPELEGLMD